MVMLMTACGAGSHSPDATDAAMDAIGDGPAAVDCGTLAATCGPMGNAPCCESPVVDGGTFYRSYDVGTDNAYTDMSYPATVSTFRLDKYEITVGRFRRFVNAGMGTRQNPPTVGAGGRTLNGTANLGGWEASFTGDLLADRTALVAALKCDATHQTWTDTPGSNESRPMNCINWYEAMAFCAWDGGFLPTEAEWNYTAVGGSEQRAYPWSSPPTSLGLDDTRASYHCFGDNMTGCALNDLVPVGTKPAGDGRWGQSDLIGNVREWTLDWYEDPYPMSACNDCASLATPVGILLRLLRGGGLFDTAGPNTPLRGAERLGGSTPTLRDVSFGARCGRTP